MLWGKAQAQAQAGRGRGRGRERERERERVSQGQGTSNQRGTINEVSYIRGIIIHQAIEEDTKSARVQDARKHMAGRGPQSWTRWYPVRIMDDSFRSSGTFRLSQAALEGRFGGEWNYGTI